jgi:hypothetical protein
MRPLPACQPLRVCPVFSLSRQFPYDDWPNAGLSS